VDGSKVIGSVGEINPKEYPINFGKEDQNGSKVRISGLQSQYTPFITR